MATVKFDVSDVEHGSSGDGEWGGNGHQPKPGLVNAVVVRATPRKENRKGTKLDKPDIEWVFEVKSTAGRPEADLEDGAWLATYTAATLRDNSFSLANVLEALKIATKTKRTGSFDTDKVAGKPVRLRIKADTYNDAYKATIGRVLPPAEASSASGSASPGAEEATPSGDGDDEPPF